jgi:hypothetical protein
MFTLRKRSAIVLTCGVFWFLVAEQLSAENGVKAQLVAPERDIVPTDKTSITIRVENDTNESISINSISLDCPDELRCDLRGGNRGQYELHSGPDAQVDIEPTKSQDFEITVRSVSWPEVLSSGYWLAFEGRDYHFNIEVSYSTGDEHSDLDQVYAAADLPFRSSLPILMLGAVVGATLVTIVDTLRRVRLWLQGRTPAQGRILRRLALIIVDILLGALLSAVAILIANQTTAFDHVLEVKVLDIWGGFLIGVLVQLGTPNSTAVWNWLRSPSQPTPPTGP